MNQTEIDQIKSMGRGIAWGVGALLLLIVAFMTAGNNETTERTVVECPWGTKEVIFDNGVYFRPFCKTTPYNHVITTELAENGISVRYRDGGKGTVDGVVRVNLPDDEETMLKLHSEVRNDRGLREKLIYPEVQQALNLTAGLMTSEEAYAEKRADFANWATEQIESGVYKTVKDPETGAIVIATDETGAYVHNRSPFTGYGIDVAGFQVTDWGFEPATEQQIQQKRSAEMAEITAIAAAEQAKQETIMVEEQGKKKVAEEKYRQMQIAQVAITEAEREKEVAVIAAERQKEVNQLALEAAEIDVQTAAQEKKATQLRADGEAYAKKAVMLADGALDKKLQAYIQTQQAWADAYAKRNVPQFVMAGGEDGATGGNADASQFQAMLTALVAKDLVVDPNLGK